MLDLKISKLKLKRIVDAVRTLIRRMNPIQVACVRANAFFLKIFETSVNKRSFARVHDTR